MPAVYLLIDPRDDSVRYVGCTVSHIRDRVLSHLAVARKNGKTRKDAWLRELMQLRLDPVVEVLAHVDADRAADVECAMIDYYAKTGLLLNGSRTGYINKRTSTSQPKWDDARHAAFREAMREKKERRRQGPVLAALPTFAEDRDGKPRRVRPTTTHSPDSSALSPGG